MKIQSINNNDKRAVSFKMKLEIENPATEKLIENSLRKLYNHAEFEERYTYFKCKPFDFKRIFNDFKTFFEDTTKHITGTAIIKKDQRGVNDPLDFSDWLRFSYVNDKGEIIESFDAFKLKNLFNKKPLPDKPSYYMTNEILTRHKAALASSNSN